MKHADIETQVAADIEDVGTASEVTKGDFMPDSTESLVLKDRIYEP